ncbi:hypothetical protein BDB01DRAFT_908736 [Pilobolus umbonatus]|nr:hypothetical protein BDB01DRAFT_908736 [Pilobolus umbonatus]
MKLSVSQLTLTALGFLSVATAAAIKRDEVTDVAEFYMDMDLTPYTGTWFYAGMSIDPDAAQSDVDWTQITTCSTVDIGVIDSTTLDSVSHFKLDTGSMRIDGNLNYGIDVKLMVPPVQIQSNEAYWEVDPSTINHFFKMINYQHGQIDKDTMTFYTKLISSSGDPEGMIDAIALWDYELPSEGMAEGMTEGMMEGHVNHVIILTKEQNVSEDVYAAILGYLPHEAVVPQVKNTC